MIKKAVILAAGKGERLFPLTETKPKPLLPIANKPLIFYQIETLRKMGIEEILIIISRFGEMWKKSLKEFKEAIKFERDRLVKGTASALLSAKKFVDDYFLVVYGDLFFEMRNFEKLIKRKRNAIVGYKVKDTSRYGKLEVKNGKLEKIKEKESSGEGLINAGIYVFSPEIFEMIEKTQLSKRGEYELTDSIFLLNKKEKFDVILLEGYWKDIGYPWDYLDANLYMLEKIGYKVGKDAKIWSSAKIIKPVIIGDECEIKNAVVEKTVLGNKCKVGEFCIVKRSVIMDKTKIPHLNYVGDSIIGENCNLGAGTIIANVRHDDKNVCIKKKGIRIDAGRRKFGAVIGDEVKTGIHTSIFPGTLIGNYSWTEPNSIVKGVIPSNSYVKVNGGIVERN